MRRCVLWPTVLSKQLEALALTLGLLSVAIAAPAEYKVLPEKGPQNALGQASSSQVIVVNSPPQNPAERTTAPRRADNAPVRALITRYAREYGVSEYMMLSIAEIESGFDPSAKNPGSSAQGIFQFLKGTFAAMGCPGDRLNAEDNIRCAAYVLSNSSSTGGINHWLADPRTARLLKQYKVL